MADDPRQGRELTAYLDGKGIGFELGLKQGAERALAATGPLRDLLVDQERALPFAAKARYEAWRAAWVAQGGNRSESPTWAELPGLMQRHWLAETTRTCSAVLAALREVAGL